jgi:hypothetical protein
MVLKTVTNSLSVQDFIFPAPVGGGQTRSDEYNFLVSIGNTPTQIDLVTSTPGYDPYLQVLDTRTNSVIFSNDDGGGFPNSRLNINNLQVGVPYKIRVTSFSTSFNQTIDNNYTLTVNTAQGDFELEPRLSSFINSQSGINITKTGRLDDKDFTFPTPVIGNTSLADEYEFIVSVPNQPIKIALNGLTAGYDPFLQVINARTGLVVRFDDDSGPGSDSLINNFTAQPGIDYRIRVTSFNQIVPNINNPIQYSLEVDGQGVSVTLAERGVLVNNPPTAVSLANAIGGLAENTPVGTGIKVGDITITDDGLGTNNLSLSGADAGSFTINGLELFYTGASPDFETKNQYNVTVNVDDPAVGATPDAFTNVSLNITDVDETVPPVNNPPSAVSLTNPISGLPENTPVGTGIKVGDITITDDGLGTNNLSLTGADAGSFSINGLQLFYTGASPDFETKNQYNVTVNVDDTTVGATPDASTNFTLNITDVSEPDQLLNTTFSRFQNKDRRGTYLFAGPQETQSILQNFPNFQPEGTAFKAAVQPNDDLIRFNRFQNTSVPGTYLFAGETESQSIRQNFPNFKEEGIAFYAYDGNASKGVDFFRFQNTQQPGTYIFVGQQERDSILANFPQFQLEGVAFEVAV